MKNLITITILIFSFNTYSFFQTAEDIRKDKAIKEKRKNEKDKRLATYKRILGECTNVSELMPMSGRIVVCESEIQICTIRDQVESTAISCIKK